LPITYSVLSVVFPARKIVERDEKRNSGSVRKEEMEK